MSTKLAGNVAGVSVVRNDFSDPQGGKGLCDRRVEHAVDCLNADTSYQYEGCWTDRKTVISLDMGLYQPAKKLQMQSRDLHHLILRPGELHIVMAQLRPNAELTYADLSPGCMVPQHLGRS